MNIYRYIDIDNVSKIRKKKEWHHFGKKETYKFKIRSDNCENEGSSH